CKSLKSIEIPEWVTTVNSSAFYNCEALTSITFPKSVSTVMKAAGTDAPSFSGCASLKEINFENPSLDVSLFTIPNNEGLVINCASKTQYDAVVAMGLTNATVNFEIAPGNLMTDGSGYQYAYENGVMTITKADTTSSTTLSSDITLDFKADVTTIVIGEDTGITVLGANIFDGFAAETVVIPSTLTTIGAASFANMPNLKTVVDYTAYTADNTAVSGIINIMTATSVAADAFSGSCAALAPVVYMGKTVSISGETFSWFAEDATETIYVYPSTSATTFFRNNSITFEYLTVDQTGDALLAREYSKWVFDTESGKLTWNLNGGHLNVGKGETTWTGWKAVWKDAIEYFFIENATTDGAYIYYQHNDAPFSNLINLKHVHMGGIKVLRRSTYGTNGLFRNCPSLTTVSYGDDSTYDEVVDLTWWKKNDYMMSAMFYNCSSIKKVILPATLTKYDPESSSEIGIFSSMFNGCSSLEEIEVGKAFEAFYDNAFKGCTSLKSVKLAALPLYYDLTAFPDQEGLTIEVANSFVASLFEDYNFTLTKVTYPEGEANSYFVEVAQPKTNIIGDLSAIRPVDSAAELDEIIASSTPPAAVLVNVDSSLNVSGLDMTVSELLASLEYRIFAAFRVSDSATVTALNDYLTSIGFTDVYIVGTPALIAESYALNYTVHHVVDYSDVYTEAITSGNCAAIRREIYKSGAKMAILPYSALSRDIINELYKLSVITWMEMPETVTEADKYASVLSGAVGIITEDTDDILDIACNVIGENTMARYPATSGHRGNETVCPENTLEGCLYAVNHGAQSVEIDIYITTDGEIVLMHDGDTERTCNAKLTVEKSTLAQLKELYVNKGFEDHELYSQCRIPTLDEIFAALKDYDVLINIEFKTTKTAAVDAVIALIEEYDMYEKCCFSSFRFDQFKRMHDKYPELPGIMLFRPILMQEYSADLNSIYVINSTGNYNANASLTNTNNVGGAAAMSALIRRGVPVQSWSGTGLKVRVESGMHMIGDGYAYFPNSLYVDGVSSSVAPGTSETLVASYKDYNKTLNEATGVTYRIIEGESLATIDPETGVITYGAEAGSVSFIAEYKYFKDFTSTTVEYTVSSDVYTVEISSGVTDDTVRGNFLSDGTGFGYELDGDVLTVVADLTTSGSVLSKDVSLDFSSAVKTIIIPDVTEITEIAANMFEAFAAETVVIPSTLTTVGSKAFAGMTNLKTVVPYAAYVSDNTAGSGAINLLTVTSFADDAFEKSASSHSVSVLFAKNAPVPGEGFAWFDSDTTVTYYTYPTCNIAEYFRDNEIDFKYLTEEQTGDALLSREAATTVMSWVFDEELGRLTLTRSDGKALSFTADTSTTWQNWKNTWSDAIEEFYLNMSHWRIYYQKHDSPFSNLKNLKHIHFNRTTLRLDRSTTGTNGLFQNCTSLTTISYGTDDTYDEVIDLGCWSTQDNALTSMFYGCSSIKKVILSPTVKKNDADDPDVSIASSFFRNCTSLTEVEIPANFLSISSNAFAGCTNLKYVKILGELPNGVNATAFPDQEGLTIDVPSYNVAVKFDACNFTKTKIVYPFNGIVAMNGFSVRLTGYNGLRGLFTADWTKIAEYEEAGYELLDFGTLVSSAANRANCVLTGEYGNYTVAGNVVNTPIWNKTDGIVGKYLTSSDDALEFAVTVINFAEANYMSNVYFCAYEIWKNPEGEIEILYKDCDGTDYDEMSLARMCSIMYEDGIITEENDTEGMVKDLADHYEENRTKNILFIGNSFTYYNDMPTAIFPVVAKAAGKDVNVTAITNGGHTLAEFASSSDTYGAKVAEAFKNNSYDIVIIQEQSHRPISNPESFYAAARDLKEMARQNGAELYLYATWGYDADHTSLATYGKDTADMEMKLRAAYQYIGEEMGVPVCHVGAAMTHAFTNSDV
ncbi:MAG: leucine-rich repeat protein, partial [Bacteroidaceae bacterium]|nr:leucine-rich repeat protein [Bacteroidaceae bacterium]